MVPEDMESSTPDDDARLLLGQFSEDLRLGKIDLLRGYLTVFLLHVATPSSSAKLLVETAEVVPPVGFGGFDALHFLNGQVEFGGQSVENGLVVNIDAEQLAELVGDFPATRTELTVDGDDEFRFFHRCLY